MPGKAGQLAHVGVEGAACVVAQAQVVDETLSKRGHGASPRLGKEETPRANPQRTWRNAAPQPAKQRLCTINVRGKREPQTTAQRFSCVPSMIDSLGVKVPYPT